MVDRRLDLDPLSDLASSVAIVSPSRRTVSSTGSPLSALSRTRATIVWSLPTMPISRRLDELDAAVALALVAGDEDMQRRVEAERREPTRGCRARRRR